MNDKLIKYGADQRVFAEASLYPDLQLARITSQYKDLYKIITQSGEFLAEVSGKFRYNASDLSVYPAVGDFVMVDNNNDSGSRSVIHNVLTRKSAFERPAVGMQNEIQVVASNIDIVFICMSLNSNYNLSRLERYLSVAWSSGSTPVVILTKSDLCDNLPKILNEVESVALAVDVIVTSGFDESSKDRVLTYLKSGVTASFIGSSGVGKSTLINLLAGKELMDTSDIRGGDDRGRHTTTRRELILLPCGGIVIDTPGMRELGADSSDLSKSFSDIDSLADMCRFSDCTHTNEPDCAVAAALKNGSLDERRYQNYLKLKKEARYDGLNSRQIENEKINSMFGSKSEMKSKMKHVKNNKKY